MHSFIHDGDLKEKEKKKYEAPNGEQLPIIGSDISIIQKEALLSPTVTKKKFYFFF